MRFVLEIECDNAAFAGDDDELAVVQAQEVSRILRRAAEQVEEGAEYVRLKDINGNRVGTARFIENGPPLVQP